MSYSIRKRSLKHTMSRRVRKAMDDDDQLPSNHQCGVDVELWAEMKMKCEVNR